MGSSSKHKSKDKESRKRRHRSPTSDEYYDAPRDKYETRDKHDAPREKRHKHKHKHHKDKKRERSSKQSYESVTDGNESDVVEVIPEKPQTREKSPEASGQGADSLSIEETNKLRAKLGLKPLDVTSEPSTSSPVKKRDETKKHEELKKDDLGEFYHKPAENWAAKAEQEKIRAKLAEHKEKRLLQNKLAKVKTLGESDSEDDAHNWIEKSRKIDKAKKEAEKRAKMLEELDAQFGISDIVESEERKKRKDQYTAKSLRGLKVNHDVDSFAEERDVILTLQDKGVLEEDEDVLVNVNMVDNEKYKKNVEIKKKKVLYNAYEDQEYDEFGNPKEKSLLAQYDEEIDGPKRDGFRIGSDNAVERKQAVAQSIKEKLAKKKLESIGEKNLVLYSEYYNDDELAKFKKPKKKFRKMRAKGKLSLDELPQTKTGIEQIGSRRDRIKQELELTLDDIPHVDYPTDIKIEDDDKDDILEKALNKARKMKQRENLVAEILKSEIKPEPEDDNMDTGNIVLNATAEFCRTLGDIPTYGKAGNRDEDEDLIDYEKETIEENNSDDDCEIIEPTGWNSVDPSSHGVDSSHIAPQEVQILGEEPDVSTGVAAALKLAMSKGYLDKEQNNRPSNSRLAHLQAQHYSIEDKAYGEEGGGNERGGRGRERYCGPVSDFREKEGFKPNVKLEYIDDDGHVLNSKEAFRYLSHKFHGKGPGKNKVEKRIKKGIQEQLMKKMSSTDTPLGTLNMLQAKQKETQSAFVVLSGSKQQQSTVISKNRH